LTAISNCRITKKGRQKYTGKISVPLQHDLWRVRRFNYRKKEKVYKEFMLYAIGRNINKYHRFLHGELKKFEGKMEEKAV
jgi:hypothetical protein